MEELLRIFTSSETPFLLLFVILFWWYIREAKAREKRYADQKEEDLQQIESKIQEVQQDLKIMLTIWKILIDKEIERRSKNGS
jgi:hypothetical protein